MSNQWPWMVPVQVAATMLLGLCARTAQLGAIAVELLTGDSCAVLCWLCMFCAGHPCP